MRYLHTISGSVCIVALALPTVRQSQEPRVIGIPSAEFGLPFTRVGTVRELKDGRLLVVDEREGSVTLIDFKSSAAKQVGRSGAGPGEYGYPGRLLALPGDSSLLHDPRNARYLVIRPDGTPGETFSLDRAVAASLGSRGSIPRGTDSRGAIYFEAVSQIGQGAAPLPVDSAALLRFDRRDGTLDTVAWVRLAKGDVRVTPGPGKGVSITTGAQAFPTRDDWVALPEGGIAVVRVRDYHVDWYPMSGKPVSASPVRFAPITVTEREKEAWRAERRSRVVSRSVGGTQANLPEPEWPATMPPFVYWQTFSRPNGDLWVLRSHKADTNPVYDVFSALGALRERVALPVGTRLVGFGNATAYLVRRDDDDLEHLQRYSWP
jgi:hypothetical protein